MDVTSSPRLPSHSTLSGSAFCAAVSRRQPQPGILRVLIWSVVDALLLRCPAAVRALGLAGRCALMAGMRPGPIRSVQSPDRDERVAGGGQRGRICSGSSRPGLPQGHDREKADDADDDDGGFDDARSDEAKRGSFVLPLDHREQRNRGADAQLSG